MPDSVLPQFWFNGSRLRLFKALMCDEAWEALDWRTTDLSLTAWEMGCSASPGRLISFGIQKKGVKKHKTDQIWLTAPGPGNRPAAAPPPTILLAPTIRFRAELRLFDTHLGFAGVTERAVPPITTVFVIFGGCVWSWEWSETSVLQHSILALQMCQLLPLRSLPRKGGSWAICKRWRVIKISDVFSCTSYASSCTAFFSRWIRLK